jgi:opacity protein-like surface antigen
VLLLAAGTAVAQDSDNYPRVETSPAFTYVHNSPVLGGSQSFNCYGFGGTIAYNFTSLVGLAADLGNCRVARLDNTYGIGSKVKVNEGTYVFGPRFPFRNFGKLQPFLETSFGVEYIKVKCSNGSAGNACGSVTVQPLPTDTTVIIVANPNATSVGKNAFALTLGGGLDIKFNKKFALRLVQAEYLYTRFGNDCQFAVCSNNNGQNSFRLKVESSLAGGALSSLEWFLWMAATRWQGALGRRLTEPALRHPSARSSMSRGHA